MKAWILRIWRIVTCKSSFPFSFSPALTVRFRICSLCWPSRTAAGRERKGNRFVFRSKYKISLMFFSPSSSDSRSSPLLTSPDTAKSVHFGESLMQSPTEVIQVQSWTFFYLKCKQDKICSFSSSVFLKEKAARPNTVRDSAKKRKVLSVTKDLTVWFLFQNMVRLLLKLTAMVSHPCHPLCSHARQGLAVGVPHGTREDHLALRDLFPRKFHLCPTDLEGPCKVLTSPEVLAPS